LTLRKPYGPGCTSYTEAKHECIIACKPQDYTRQPSRIRLPPKLTSFMNPIKDYYRILGVRPNASIPEIRRAYRQLAILNHPDKNPNGQSMALMQEINEAYGVLGNPKKRTSYDLAYPNITNTFTASYASYSYYSATAVRPEPFFIQNRSTFLAIAIFLILSVNFLVLFLTAEYLGPATLVILFLCLNTLVVNSVFTPLWNQFRTRESESRCPKCTNLWVAEIMSEKLLGIFKKYPMANYHNHNVKKIRLVWYEKYRVYCKCTSCGHQWTFTKSRRR
jgi:DnaJ-like protein